MISNVSHGIMNITFIPDGSGGTWTFNGGNLPDWMSATGQAALGNRYFNFYGREVPFRKVGDERPINII
jgi:hypothetical protein